MHHVQSGVFNSLLRFLPGHARPLVHLSARLVKLRPVNVTILTNTAYYTRITTELARSFEPEDEEHAKRIRFVERRGYYG